MTRQQRTNYLRQHIATSAPPIWADMRFEANTVAGSTLSLTLYGTETGIRIKGIPAIRRDDTGALPISAVLGPPGAPDEAGTLDLTYAAALPAAGSYTLELRDGAVSNDFGGFLAPGMAFWPNPAVFPAQIAASYNTHAGAQVEIMLSGGVLPYCNNDGLAIINTNTTEIGIASTDGTNMLRVDFPVSGLSSGDTIELAADSNLLVGQFGGYLGAFSFQIP